MNALICMLLSVVALFQSFNTLLPNIDSNSFSDPPSASESIDGYSIAPFVNDVAGYSGAHYRVTLPRTWEENTVTDIHEQDFAYAFSFYEKNSYEEGYGGKLFTVYADSVNQDFSYLPAYEIIGTLVKEGQPSWTLVAVYPTDVQFSPEHYDIYNEMSAQIPEILNNITAQGGYKLIRG